MICENVAVAFLKSVVEVDYSGIKVFGDFDPALNMSSKRFNFDNIVVVKVEVACGARMDF
jgi:hypothetical protein